eukprot:6208684-Pleurochrysis_carterae.AAC.1
MNIKSHSSFRIATHISHNCVHTLSTTHGSRCCRCCKYGRSDLATAAAPVPTTTRAPLLRRYATPALPNCGSGSASAMWMSRSPLSISASSHGGVLLPGPRWHGSSVTYAVAEASCSRGTSRALASARAAASACGPPFRS